MKQKFGEKLFDVLNYVFMFILSLLFIYPFWQTLVLSFSDATLISNLELYVWPKGWSLASYQAVIETSQIWIGFKNTIIRTLLGTAVSVIVTVFAAYVLTKKELPLRNFLMYLILFTMFFSGGLIPTYAVIRTLGLRDTVWALVLPTAFTAWNCIIARNFIQHIPASMEESAMLDGATPFRTVVSIIIPLSTPVIAVLCLWTAVWHWNAWFDAMIYVRDADKVVLQLVLRRLLIEQKPSLGTMDTMTLAEDRQRTLETVKGATIFISLVPILMVYPLLQKYFTKGIMIGALKG